MRCVEFPFPDQTQLDLRFVERRNIPFEEPFFTIEVIQMEIDRLVHTDPGHNLFGEKDLRTSVFFKNRVIRIISIIVTVACLSHFAGDDSVEELRNEYEKENLLCLLVFLCVLLLFHKITNEVLYEIVNYFF